MAHAHPRTQLNNLAERNRIALNYIFSGPEGPLNNCYWTCILYVNGIEWARYKARNKEEAKEAVAIRVLRALHERGYY